MHYESVHAYGSMVGFHGELEYQDQDPTSAPKYQALMEYNSTPVTTASATTIAGFTPTSGRTGSSVTITGTGFSGVSGVRIGGVSATYTVLSPNAIRATVPTAAVSGAISVTSSSGTGASANSFSVLPNITSFSPLSGRVGTVVTITGSGLRGATAVQFNGVMATTFTVLSATSIRATVPARTSTGHIRVTTPAGLINSTANFTLLP